MKLVLIIVLAFTGLLAQARDFETIYETFDGGLRIEEPFQMECTIQEKHYIIFVNFGDFQIKVLEDGEWVKPFQVRFSPDSLLVVFIEEFAEGADYATKGYGFALGNINFDDPDPIRGVYSDFVAGRTKGNPYVHIPHACDFIDQ